MLDYINGINLQKTSHYIIDFNSPYITSKILSSNAIIFCKTDFINPLFNCIQNSIHKYILITHMSDYPIDFNRFSAKPSNIIKWFAQNAVYSHPDLISIPIGLENHIGFSKGNFTNHKWFEENLNILQTTQKNTSVLYCNWKSTNPDRNNIVDLLDKKAIAFKHESNLSFEQYCINMSKHKFVIAPPGNGVDTHRCWEALYMNCIPIVIKHHIYDNYNLPILQVNSYDQISYELLETFLQKSYINKEQLTTTYWNNLILSEFKKL
jgi:hypothetical protein